MVMLSDLLRFRVRGQAQRKAALLDVVVDLSPGDYPLVVALVVRREDGAIVWADWSEARVDWQRRLLALDGLSTATTPTEDQERCAVLLKRDVLDALVLDLEQRRAALANDLWLREEGGRLWLRGADLSAWALVRRVARGALGRGRERSLVDWKSVEFLRGDPAAARAGHDYHRRVSALPPAQITRLLEPLPYLHAAELLTLLPLPVATDAFEAMAPERQLQVLEELDGERAAGLLRQMAPDLAADLVGRLDPRDAQRFLEQLPRPRREQLLDLLRYPDDTAGGIMTNDVVVAPAGMRVGEARRALAEPLKGPAFVYYVFVVDDDEQRHLVGVVSLRDLLVRDDGERLDAVMATALETIDPLEPAGPAARRVLDTGLPALPVVARDGRLLGLVTFDAALAHLAPESWRQQMVRVFS